MPNTTVATPYIRVRNSTGPSLAPGDQGEYLLLPSNTRSGGKDHLWKAGEELTLPGTVDELSDLRTLFSEGKVAVVDALHLGPSLEGPFPVLEVVTTPSGTVDGVFDVWINGDPTLGAINITAEVASLDADGNYTTASIGGGNWSPAITSITPAFTRPGSPLQSTLDVSAALSGVVGEEFMLLFVTSVSPDIQTALGPFRL